MGGIQVKRLIAVNSPTDSALFLKTTNSLRSFYCALRTDKYRYGLFSECLKAFSQTGPGVGACVETPLRRPALVTPAYGLRSLGYGLTRSEVSLVLPVGSSLRVTRLGSPRIVKKPPQNGPKTAKKNPKSTRCSLRTDLP